MSASTITPGVLSVGSALPDPPFELRDGGSLCGGFDIELTQAIAAQLGLRWHLVPYAGSDFNGIFAGLATTFDCVASGATITPDRERVAAFCTPYIRSGQSLVCNIEATPQVHSIDDLRGMVLGVQHGNTSEPVAHRLKAEGRIADVRTYAYDDIGTMLDDLDAAKIGAVMKLAPVMHWLTRNRPRLRVVQEGITDEQLGVAVSKDNAPLHQAIDAAQARLRDDGTLPRLVKTWLVKDWLQT